MGIYERMAPRYHMEANVELVSDHMVSTRSSSSSSLADLLLKPQFSSGSSACSSTLSSLAFLISSFSTTPPSLTPNILEIKSDSRSGKP